MASGAAAALTLGAAASGSPVTVWTQHNDNARTGQNTHETTLNVSNVNKNTFGKLFSYPVDDQIYTQPLYMPALTMPVDGKVHNVVYVATVNNSLYAFDADDPTANGGQPLWSRNFTPSGMRPPIKGDIAGWYNDFDNNMGIVGTPVIDTAAGVMYLVSRHTDGNGTFVQHLHAINIRTGAEQPNSPVVIDGSFTGGGNTVTFDNRLQNQRPALLLQNGNVYIAWASHGDTSPYHGWIIGYRTSDLAKVTVWNTTPSGDMSSIWQSGQGLTTDSAGNIYFMTGNGTFDGVNNFGESVIKMSSHPDGSLTYTDFFAPSNWDTLNAWDADLGSAGVLGIPGTKLIVCGGKEGKLYLLNTDNLGQVNSVDNVVQEFQATSPTAGQSGHIHGTPIYWKTATGQYIYVWGENDYLRQYQFTNGADANHGSFNTSATSHSPFRAPLYNGGMPGGFLSISSNGNAANTGIVWAATPYDDNANQQTVAGILSAFDASDVSHVLWTSKDFPSRDDIGRFAKFVPPTVTNGKVYIPSWGDRNGGPCQLFIYGLVPPPAAGTGLRAEYFNDPSNSAYPLTNPFTNPPVLTRTDPTVDFDWGNDSPNPVVNIDQFSARWTGAVVPRYSETYTFHMNSDNGRRLWVNGQLVIDKWIDDWGIDYTGQIALQAGKKYDIRIEYFEDGGGANVNLRWESPSQTLQVIPQSQLFPPATAQSIAFNTPSGDGGVAVAVGVTIASPAKVGGVQVAMSSSDAGAIPPGTMLTIPEGATGAWLRVVPSAVASNTVITATATLGGVAKSANFTVTPPTLQSLTASATTGGQPLIVKATLLGAAPAGGVMVPVASNSSAVIGGSVTIPAGAQSATASLTTKAVSTDTPVTLTGAYGGVTQTANVTLLAGFQSIAFAAPSGYGGVSTSVGVSLYAPAGPNGVTVNLSSPGSTLFPAGTTLTIPAGSYGAWVRCTPAAVSNDTVITATASRGSAVRSATYLVKAPVLKSLTANSTVAAGLPLTVRVTLQSPAPGGGVTIPVTSNSPAIAGSGVSIPGGGMTGSINLNTSSVSANTPVVLTATYRSATQTANVTVQPAFQTIAFASPSGYGGVATSVGVSLYAPAGPGGLTIALSSPGSSLIPSGATLTIPAGSYGAWYRVTPSVVASDTVVTATATLGSMSKSANYTVKAR
ncbi:hypothetical protein CCAX7_18470 [Capsulimonas corticalis]|uniref:PA14 domain-containing protein n=1 Tax=Capsulimonas corticalis TaxID=2219043 RepID=A0A9N7QAI8_9BACT|nr:hypothetical protein CCAX7_18470 [Capsulimonas corticalis]